ncbi:MAG: PIN domain-containing protein [Candidatus Heimdallarchaeota archaeon]|nr:PIN domain-containing protein [Candidatus Heimdallarchaeota archaeon]
MIDSHLSFLNSYQGPIIIDSALWIEYYSNSNIGKRVRRHIIDSSKISKLIVHQCILTEIYAVLHKILGNQASEIMNDMLGFVRVVPLSKLSTRAGELMSLYSLPISDSFTLAIAQEYDIPIYMRMQKRLEKIHEDLRIMVIE